MGRLASCNATTLVPPAPRVPTPAVEIIREHSAPIETTSSTTVETPTSFDVFASNDPTDLEGWRLVLARRGTRVRIGLKSNGTSGISVEFEGSIIEGKSDSRVDAHVSTSKGTLLSLVGVIQPSGELRGTISGATAREALDLHRQASPNGTEAKWTNRFGGTLEKTHRFRLDWTESGEHAVAKLSRINEATRTFEGILDRQTGRFELHDSSQPWNRLRGILSNGPGDVAGIGEWLHDDQTEAISFDRFYPTYPAVRSLPSGARVVPLERFHKGFPDCPTTGDVFPSFEGLASATTLNRELDKMLVPLVDCDDSILSFLGSLWSGSTYSVTASRDGWVGFAIERNSYMGGAHGSSMTTCVIADTETGKVVHLNQEIEPASFARLSAVTRTTLLAGKHKRTLVDLGFFEDDAKVDANREVCVVEDHGRLYLEVVYQNDIDEAGNFHFANVRPHLAAAVVRPFFPPGAVGARVFR